MRIEVSEYLEEDETSIGILTILHDYTPSRFSAAFSEKSARVYTWGCIACCAGSNLSTAASRRTPSDA
jgi:hypothetical protein